jgi:hypothetical protein
VQAGGSGEGGGGGGEGEGEGEDKGKERAQSWVNNSLAGGGCGQALLQSMTGQEAQMFRFIIVLAEAAKGREKRADDDRLLMRADPCLAVLHRRTAGAIVYRRQKVEGSDAGGRG